MKIRTIACSGSAREMGCQYGEQAREDIRTNLEVFGATWASETLKRHESVSRALLSRWIPEVLEELEGIAEGAGVPASSILRLNQQDTFGDLPDADGNCTPMAIRFSDAGLILGKNNDGSEGASYRYVLRKSRPDRGLPLLQVTYAGWLSGLDAMNAEGLVNGHSSVGSRFDKAGRRVDIRLWSYALMRQVRFVADFAQGMLDAPLTGKGFSIVALDAAGHTAVIEAAMPLVAVRDRDRPFVYSTNLYVSEALKNADLRSPGQKEIAMCRYGYLRWMEQTRPPARLADLQDLLRSHDPWAPCRHGGPHGSWTEWSMVGLPAERRFLLSKGAPCEMPYREHTLHAAHSA